MTSKKKWIPRESMHGITSAEVPLMLQRAVNLRDAKVRRERAEDPKGAADYTLEEIDSVTNILIAREGWKYQLQRAESIMQTLYRVMFDIQKLNDVGEERR